MYGGGGLSIQRALGAARYRLIVAIARRRMAARCPTTRRGHRLAAAADDSAEAPPPPSPSAAEDASPKTERSPAPVPLELVVSLCEVTHISRVDAVSQQFSCQFLLGLRVVGGARDEDLKNPEATVNKHDDGSLHASLAWYATRIELSNAINFVMIENVVRSPTSISRRSHQHLTHHSITTHRLPSTNPPPQVHADHHGVEDDLMLWLRAKGDFLDVMELEMYPFDQQALTVSIGLTNRLDGPFPVKFVADHRAKTSLQPDGFALVETEYRCGEVVLLGTESGTEGRRFPRLNISVMVTRRPAYALVNVALPLGIVASLAGLQFLVPVDEVPDRLSISLSLLLTTAAYKFAVSTMVPAISYLTLLDKYVLGSSCFIVLIILESAIVGRIAAVAEQRQSAEDIEFVLVVLLYALFMLFHGWFAWRACNQGSRRKKFFFPSCTHLHLI